MQTGAPLGILGPMKRIFTGPPNTAAEFFDAILHTIMHFNGIFDYHYQKRVLDLAL